MIHRTFRACGVAILIGVWGCGGATPQAKKTPGPTVASAPALWLLPSKPVAVIRANVAELRQSPHYPTLEAWIEDAVRATGPKEHAFQAHLTELVSRIDSVAAALYPGPGQSALSVLVVKGTFEDGELERLMREQAEATSGAAQITRQQVDGWDVLGHADVEAVEPAPRTWVTWSPALRARAVDRIGTPAALELDPALADAFGTVDGDERTVGLVAAPSAIVAHWQLPLAAEADPSKLNAIAAGVSLTAGLKASILISSNVEDVAPGLAMELAGARDHLAENVFLSALGLGPLIEAIKIEATETSVHVHADVDESAVSTILNRSAPVLRAAIGAKVGVAK